MPSPLPPLPSALIVDDEVPSRERLRMLLARRGDVVVAGEAASGAEALAAIEEVRPGLVFLDIQMPGMTGFDVIRVVGPERMPPVIFVTAYDRHALRAFEVHALDYLLKPVSVERFDEAVTRALSLIGQSDERLTALVGPEGEAPPLERLFVRTHRKGHLVTVAEIDWVEAAGNYVALHVGDERHLLRQTMATLEEQLDPDRFLRIHRSAIVNLDRVQELRPNDSGAYDVILRTGHRLTMSRSYRAHLDRFSLS